MKNHWAFKLTALVLAVLSAAALAVSGLIIAVGCHYDLYRTDSGDKVESLIEDRLDNYAYDAAHSAAIEYHLENKADLSAAEYEVWQDCFSDHWYYNSYWPEFEYSIYDGVSGEFLAATQEDSLRYAKDLTVEVRVPDGTVVDLRNDQKEFPHYEDLPMNYEWTDYFGYPLPDLNINTLYYDLVYRDDHVYRVEYFEDVTYTVRICLTDADVEYLSQSVQVVSLIQAVEPFVDAAIPAAIISAVVALACFLYLGFAAGKKPGTVEIQPRGTNRLPLDLVAFGGGLGILFLFYLGYELSENTVYTSTVEGVYWYIAAFAACAGALGLVAALMLTALCAQVRLGSRAWLKGTIVGKCWGFCWNCVKKLWNFFVGGLRKAARCVGSVFAMLPLIWQWLLAYGVIILLALWSGIFIWYDTEVLFLIFTILGVLLVLYSAYAFGKLRDSAKRMSRGDLDTKIDIRKDFLYGCFGEFAGDLNTLGDTCVEAAVERTKSERMKSELITNVSHDIKTPLTSIINYVDLLRRAETEEQKAEYLEVLDRQSQRLKKLIEDLMEMSKASSGNIAVELGSNDVVEAVNQALGEFADRLEAQNLNVIFRQQGDSVSARCDGKLLWRVMSNVLVNVVKYALPGTRVYIDVLAVENRVYVSFKNISREPLNISAEELMERFVRGDRSRNSEGNGLGLNIARSLMEAQGGDLILTVDGDLFKVTLTLNAG